MKNLHSLQKEGVLCDLLLRCRGGQVIPVHANVMCASSNFFKEKVDHWEVGHSGTYFKGQPLGGRTLGYVFQRSTTGKSDTRVRTCISNNDHREVGHFVMCFISQAFGRLSI